MKRSAVSAVVAWLVLLAIGAANLCAEDELARMLNLTRESKSLPIWIKPDERAVLDLSGQVRSINPSIFIIGHPKGGYGTGFVLSQKHRLLATNAHVADIQKAAGQLLAIGNDSSQVFHVDRVWYHPGVVRELKSGFRARSQDPGDGDVFPLCADVAVLHVSGTADLPKDLPLANPQEVYDLFAKPVGMLGFPGHDTVSWPGLGEKAKATYRQGVIARATDFENNANADPRDLQYLQHTMANWFGFSGSPIFLVNGRVAALNNSAQKVEKRGMTTTLAFGIRADCLWELLAFHHLDDKVPVPIPVSDLRLARFTGEDPRIRERQQVEDLLVRGKILQSESKLSEAGDLFWEAVRRAPNYAEAHYWKAMNHCLYGFAEQENSPYAPEVIRQYELAVKHIAKAVELDPTNPRYMLDWATMRANLENVRTRRRVDHAERRVLARKVLELGGLSTQIKAVAHVVIGGSYALPRDGIPWFSKALEIFPYDQGALLSRAAAYRVVGEHSLADADFQRAEELEKADACHWKAWRLSTSPDAAVRDGAQAVRLAKDACEITDYGCWQHLDGLAAAYAESGNFDEAVRWATKAYELAGDAEKSDVAARLRKYRDRKPHRQ